MFKKKPFAKKRKNSKSRLIKSFDNYKLYKHKKSNGLYIILSENLANAKDNLVYIDQKLNIWSKNKVRFHEGMEEMPKSRENDLEIRKILNGVKSAFNSSIHQFEQIEGKKLESIILEKEISVENKRIVGIANNAATDHNDYPRLVILTNKKSAFFVCNIELN